MSDKYLHRHDLTDEQWSILGPILPGQKGQWGGVAKDNRLFMNAVLWIEDECALARFAERVWEIGKRASAISSVARCGCLGAHFKRIGEALQI